MSISRIESAYAYFLDRKISLTQMAVLQALAYHANEETEECHPSNATLAREVHTSANTVGTACKALKKMGAIDWVKGGQFEGVNVANVYTFLFPRMKMPTKRERYEAILAKRGVTKQNGHRAQAPLPQYQSPLGTGTQSPSAGVPTQFGSNTEDNRNPKTKIKSEREPEGALPSFDFKFAGCANKGMSIADAFDHDRSSPQQAAMALCGVNDVHNQRTFGKYMGIIGMTESWYVVDAFRLEIEKNGEHKNAKNRAAILTGRLKDRAIELGLLSK